MLAMPKTDRAAFDMHAQLEGQSQSIFQRVFKKFYGEQGATVLNQMFSDPFSVVPVVLTRMRQKDEEWRFTQREWEKVWRAQTNAMHLKSLDHMGIQVKQNDKRNLSAKHLVDVIKTKHEEQRRARSLRGSAPRYQFVWTFDDEDIILSLLRLMVVYAHHSGQQSESEKAKSIDFFETFVNKTFGIPRHVIAARLPKYQTESDEDAEEHVPEATNGRNRRNATKNADLRRDVLDPGRNGTKPSNTKEDSAGSGSKETTPDVVSANEEDGADTAEENAPPESPNPRWMPIMPRPTVAKGVGSILDADGELVADASFSRPWYNFFCNQTIFVFHSIFQVLYKRLKDIKGSTASVSEEIVRLNRDKPAHDLGLIDNKMEFFTSNDDPSTFWKRTCELIEEYITGDVDEARYQEVLRHYYLKNGWTLYTIQDLLKTMARLSLTCWTPDTKDKTKELVDRFYSSLENEETKFVTEIEARKAAEKSVKDGDLFVIRWVSLNCLIPPISPL
jgi:paired amphipathic helix protein Sin3a